MKLWFISNTVVEHAFGLLCLITCVVWCSSGAGDATETGRGTGGRSAEGIPTVSGSGEGHFEEHGPPDRTRGQIRPVTH